MKGKLFVATTAAAALLALATACGGEKVPTPTPTPNLGAPYSCVEPGKSPIAHLAPGVTFNVASVLGQIFPGSYGSDDFVKPEEGSRRGFVCDKVLSLEEYTVAIGNDTVGGRFFSIAYVFKSSQQSSYSLKLVGTAPNRGQHKQAVILEDKDLGDLLILGSQIRSLEDGPYDPENGLMLNEIAQAHNFRNFLDDRNNVIHYGSKIAVYRLNSPQQIQPYNPNIKPEVVVLEKIAAWPVLFGWDVEIEGMRVVEQDGKAMLEIKTSEIKPNVNRCQLIPGVVDLERVIKGGIVTDVPLLKDVYCK